MAYINKMLYGTKQEEQPTTNVARDKSLWPTPQLFFDELNKEFGFTLDVAANADNHKCAKYYTQEQNGLDQSWDEEKIWCNPPYGRKDLPLWTRRAVEACRSPNGPEFVVMLLPLSMDTRWFHDWIAPYAHEIRVYKGRLRFGDGEGKAPFGSMVIVYRKGLRPEGTPIHFTACIPSKIQPSN